MIIDIIDAFRAVHRLKKEEIAQAIGISPSTIDQHRRNPEMEMSHAFSGNLSRYIVEQLKHHLHGLSSLEQHEILHVVGQNKVAFKITMHQHAVTEAFILAAKKYRYGPWGRT